MKFARFLVPLCLGMWFVVGSVAVADTTATAKISITIDALYYIFLGNGDWMQAITYQDIVAGYVESDVMTGLMNVAGNNNYRVTAQISDPVWNENVLFQVRVNSADYTTLSDSAASIIVGLENSIAGRQDGLSVQWRLEGLTPQTIIGADNWTGTVIFTVIQGELSD